MRQYWPFDTLAESELTPSNLEFVKALKLLFLHRFKPYCEGDLIGAESLSGREYLAIPRMRNKWELMFFEHENQRWRSFAAILCPNDIDHAFFVGPANIVADVGIRWLSGESLETIASDFQLAPGNERNLHYTDLQFVE